VHFSERLAELGIIVSSRGRQQPGVIRRQPGADDGDGEGVTT
jgi:hypothetical protein